MTKDDKSRPPAPPRRRLWIVVGLGLVALGLGALVHVRRAPVKSQDACHDEEDPEACLEELAGRLNDASLCAGLKHRDHCLWGVALNGANGQACEQIQDAAVRSKCAEQAVEFGGDSALCQLVEPVSRANCFALAAKQRGPEVCAQAREDERAPCLTAVASDVDDLGAACGSSIACRQALGAIDISACDGIPAAKGEELTVCLRSLDSRVGWIPDARCRELAQPAARDACFTRLARIRTHGSSCALVGNAALREQCIEKAGAVDPALCRELTDAEAKQRCFQGSSYEFPDSSICLGLDGAQHERCLVRPAGRLAWELARAQ